MKRLQNPFSVYDFLGYLTPGALAFYSFLLIFAPSTEKWNTVLSHYALDRPEMLIPLTIISYIIGHVISFLSSVTVENYSIWSLGYPSKYLLNIKHSGYWKSIKNKSNGKWEKFVRFLSRVVMALFLLPISLFDYLLGNLFYARYLYARKLDKFTREVIERDLNVGFKYVTDVIGTNRKDDIKSENFFRVIYHFCVENVGAHQNKFQNYIALYGFLRALSFLFVLLFWGIIFISTAESRIILSFTVGISAYIFYMGYNKFSRRFSLEVYMAFVTIANMKKPESVKRYTDMGNWFTEWRS